MLDICPAMGDDTRAMGFPMTPTDIDEELKMTAQNVTAKLKDQEDKDAVTVTYDFGDTLKEMVANFGEEVVANRVHAAMVIDAQSLIRRGIKAGKTQKEIQAMINEWKPGVKQVNRKSKAEKAQDLLSQLSPEDRAELLKAFKG